MDRHFLPGDRVELNHTTGNPGRKGFFLFASNTDNDLCVVRFDGFAYNALIDMATIDKLPAEPFRL